MKYFPQLVVSSSCSCDEKWTVSPSSIILITNHHGYFVFEMNFVFLEFSLVSLGYQWHVPTFKYIVTKPAGVLCHISSKRTLPCPMSAIATFLLLPIEIELHSKIYPGFNNILSLKSRDYVARFLLI